MKYFLTTPLGRLRLLALLEGTSLLLLIFIAVPAKRIWGIPTFSMIIGPIHGALFLLFVINTLSFGIEQGWKFGQTTWKVLLACIIPFGTFYIDHAILKKIETDEA